MNLWARSILPATRVVRLLAGLVAGLSSAGPAFAQPSSPPKGVMLQIRPHPGDTLRVRLDQTIEMSGTVRNGGSTSESSDASTLVVLARLAVESVDLTTATMVALTDSVRLTSAPNSSTGAMLAWAPGIEGQRFRFRVASDGSTSVDPTAGGPMMPSGGALLGQLPATLPRTPMVPGNSWTNRLEVPLSGTLDPKGAATLIATFRFDSLSRSGELAFLSLEGRLSRSVPQSKGSALASVETSGTVTGYVLVDRRRGWITDARTTVSLRSIVTPRDASRPPTRVRMTISQWMRVM